MNFRIEIFNFTTFDLPEEAFKKIARKVLKGEKIKSNSLSLIFVGAQKICKLNQRYRGKNQVTDVLTFPAMKFDLRKVSLLKEMRATEGLGEIVISPWVVKKNAQREGLDFKRELVRCIIHGILHLLGYEHERDQKSAQKMREKEGYYLALSNFD